MSAARFPRVHAGHEPTMTGGNVMTPEPGKPQKSAEQHAGNSPDTIPGGAIYSYNMDDSKTPGGIKVRWKVREIGRAHV